MCCLTLHPFIGGDIVLILGLNAYHADSAACVVREGVLIAAAEEERFRRVKHWAGFPAEAIRWCLKEAGAELSDLDVVAINQDSRANRWQRFRHLLLSRPDPGLVISRLKNRKQRAGVDSLLSDMFPGSTLRAPIMPVEHHLAHLSSAFHVSPFEEAAAVSVDGFGDFSSTAWGTGRGTEISIDKRVIFPHSLGVLYQAVTQYLGFPNYGDEYKVMGLAPYGVPRYLEHLRDLVQLRKDGTFTLSTRYFRHHRENIMVENADGTPGFIDLFSPELERLLGPRRTAQDAMTQRHMDLASSAQALYEEAFFNIVRAAQRKSGTTNVVLAGGCANNSVANGKVRRETPIRKVYVHAAPGDAGGAIGAAFVAWHQESGRPRFSMEHAYLGPSFDTAQYKGAIDARRADLEAENCEISEVRDENALCRQTALAVADGQVVGWFQGRMEWGPRALGNRSIIGDPRRADMKNILNAKIKRRESFRPFAPSVLQEFVGDWFEEDDAVPFMTQVFQIKEDKRKEIPAVTHVDGSGRLQTVSRGTNSMYAGLIEAFHAQTGVPMVLNTSFNENEPVVCRPDEALDCFLRTKMDVLVLGQFFIRRSTTAAQG